MKVKFIVIALAGLLAASGVSAQEQKGKPTTQGGGGKVQMQSQGGGNLGRSSMQMQSQNRMNVHSQDFNRNNAGTNRQFTNRQFTSRKLNTDRRFTQRNVNRNVNVNRNLERPRFVQDRKPKTKTADRFDRDQTRVRDNTRLGATSKVSNVRISDTQRLRIRQAFESHRRSFHRIGRVGFPIFIGAFWPRDYAIYDVPDYIVEYVPGYEGYKYIVVGDRLLIIDPVTLEIVAIIPV